MKRTARAPLAVARGRPWWTSSGVRKPSDVCGLSVLYQNAHDRICRSIIAIGR